MDLSVSLAKLFSRPSFSNKLFGFSGTVRETEEYSCSEEEEPVASKVEPAPDTKLKAADSSTVKSKAPTKQGSIMSFFGKK